MDECKNPNFYPNNSDINEIAAECVKEDFDSFFDGCLLKCIRDKFFLPLTQHESLESVVYGQIFPVLVLLAVFSNAAVAIVLSKKHMITPTNVVLKYMAIAELLVGLVPLPWTLYFFTLGNFEKTYQLELWWCYLQKYSMDAFPPIFHNIAMWLTVLLAGQRYVSISYPLYSRSACSVKNVRLCTVIIIIVSLVCGLPKSFDYEYDIVDGWVFFRETWMYTSSCLMVQTFLLNTMGQTLFFNIYFWTRALGFIILPSFLLVLLNALLIKGIRRAQKRKLRLLREKRSEEAARQRDSNSTSVMLVVIVSIFLIVNLPQAIFMGLLCVCETFSIKLSILEGTFPAIFLITSNMIVIVSSNYFNNAFVGIEATYPLNFGIYCFMSSSFRQAFKNLFCRNSATPQIDQQYGTSAIHIGRKSDTCSHLINICTAGEHFSRLSNCDLSHIHGKK